MFINRIYYNFIILFPLTLFEEETKDGGDFVETIPFISTARFVFVHLTKAMESIITDLRDITGMLQDLILIFEDDYKIIFLNLRDLRHSSAVTVYECSL